MDDRRFDQLTRALGGASTRRGAFAALAGMVAGVAGLGTAEAGKKRRKCDPKCPAGQTCRHGACACDNRGAVCGASCCTPGQRCENGACVAPPVPCVPAGAACKGAGAPCCDGFVCGSGQGGEGDVACYVPAGGACETTADCTYGSDCTDGACVARPEPTATPTPPTCRGSVPVTGDPAVDGEALRALAEDPDGPSTITLCAGLYRAVQKIAVTRDLAIEPAADAGGEVILDGGWSGGDATDGHQVLTVTDADVQLTGITVQRGYSSSPAGGCLSAMSNGSAVATLTLNQVRVTACKSLGPGGGIAGSGLATLAVHDCEIFGNIAGNTGGGLYYGALATVTIDGATRVTGNAAAVGGGMVIGIGSLHLGGSVLITGNTATVLAQSAGFWNISATVTCSGTPKICDNPLNSGAAGCMGTLGAGCGSICAGSCA